MANGNGKRRNRRRNRRRNGNNQTGPSSAPRVTLRRTFRYIQNVKLGNTRGTGNDLYAYWSDYVSPQPFLAAGFKEAQNTFEFYKINRFRVKAQVGYNGYNATYNTINLDAVAAIQAWTAADFSVGDSPGEGLFSYNNARVHTLSLNALKTICNTTCRLNIQNDTPKPIFGSNSWLDTATDVSNGPIWSGCQILLRMPGITSTNWMPSVQLIFEVDVEFKQPAWQNRPTTFETDIIGSSLVVIPDSSDPDTTREYKVVSYTINDSGNNVRLERADGQPGSLDYTQAEFWAVYTDCSSGHYFGNRKAIYTGPIPRKPLGV